MSNIDDYHYNTYETSKSEIFAIVIGIISTLLPLSVVFILIYKYEILVKGKTLAHYILMIAISDTISSITIALGYPTNNTPVCYAQGFLSYFFGRSSIFFTDIIIIQLLYVVLYRKFLFGPYIIHMIVWPLNIILQILPYTTNSYYGRTLDDDRGIPASRCFINSEDKNIALLWNNYVLNFWIISSFALIVICTIALQCYFYYVIRTQPSNYVLVSFMRDIRSTVIWYHHHHLCHYYRHSHLFIIIDIIIYRYPFSMLVAYVPSTCKYI